MLIVLLTILPESAPLLKRSLIYNKSFVRYFLLAVPNESNSKNPQYKLHYTHVPSITHSPILLFSVKIRYIHG